MFICTFCTKQLVSRRGLSTHMRTHTKEKPYKCLMCAATFSIERNLKKHIVSVHDGVKEIKKRNTQCPLCSYKCYSTTYLERHLRKHSSAQPFSCSVPGCGFKTKFEKCVQQHFRSIHSIERPFECPSDGCTYKSKVKSTLQSHLKRHSKLKICKVPGCTYICKGPGNLKGHNCTSEEKPWKCSVCDFQSKYKYNLVNHEGTHMKIKRFQCQARNCGYSTSQKCTLDLHLDRKHKKCDVQCPNDDMETLHCPFPDCSYQTKLSHHYNHHIATHNKKEKRNHVCIFCFSRFSHLRFLKLSPTETHWGKALQMFTL